MSKIEAHIVRISDLASGTVEQMFSLFANYYDACSEAGFRADLDDKDYVILLEDGNNIQGFSTAAHYKYMGATGSVRILFSGDTIIARQYWGEQGLSRSFAKLAGWLKANHPEEPLYWFLISKGHRTYRYLPLFAHIFYPHPQNCHTDGLAALACDLAIQRFGDAYDTHDGVIRFVESRGQLKGEWATIDESALSRPELQFFLSKNPGFTEGHELVCLTELIPANLRSVVRRAFLEGYTHGLG